MQFFLSCDGEQKQIEAFQDSSILNLFSDSGIAFAKTPASCSAICQPSDASPFFKGVKTHLKKGSGNVEPYEDPSHLRARQEIDLALTDRSFSADKKTTIAKALLRVVVSLRLVSTPQCIKKGYFVTGQYPISFERAMAQCPSLRSLSLEQIQTMRDNVDNVATLFKGKGEVTEAEMDELLIFKVKGDEGDTRPTPKDSRAMYQQRAVLMNAAETIKKFIEYQNRKRVKAALPKNPATGKPLTAFSLYKAWYESLSGIELAEENIIRKENGALARRAQKGAELLNAGAALPAPTVEVLAEEQANA